MGAYAAEHADAHAEVVAAGGPAVTFVKETRVRSATDGSAVRTVSSVTGVAVRVPARSMNDNERMEPGSLKEHRAMQLVFVPDTYGDAVEAGYEVVWADGEKYAVREADPRAPDGVVILQFLVVER